MLILYSNHKEMLPFGSIAPGILLPILAFAYMLYFGVCALNKGYKGDENSSSHLSPEKTQLIVTGKASLSVDHTSYFYYQKGEKPGAITGNCGDLSAHKQNIFQVIKIPEIRIIYKFNRIFPFSRPPPLSL
jgi:hypothetical protein